MNHELNLLLDFLKTQSEPETIKFVFSESGDKENLYALGIQTEDTKLCHLLATYFGGPDECLCEGQTEFESSHTWYGKGRGNLRTLADEYTQLTGEEFFETTLSIAEIQSLLESEKQAAQAQEIFRKILGNPPNTLLVGGSIATFKPYADGEALEEDLGYLTLPEEVGGGFTICESILKTARFTPNGGISITADDCTWSVEAFKAVRYDDELTYIGFTKPHLQVLRSALDLYCRLGIGAFETAGDIICELHSEKAQEINKTGWDLKEEIFQPLKAQFGFPGNGSHGITNAGVNPLAKTAHDIQNVVDTELHGPGRSKLKVSEDADPVVL